MNLEKKSKPEPRRKVNPTQSIISFQWEKKINRPGATWNRLARLPVQFSQFDVAFSTGEPTISVPVCARLPCPLLRLRHRQGTQYLRQGHGLSDVRSQTRLSGLLQVSQDRWWWRHGNNSIHRYHGDHHCYRGYWPWWLLFYYFLLIIFCSCVCICLYGPFNCISVCNFSRPLSVFWLFFRSALLVLSTTYLFMEVSFSPDIIPSGWLGSKRQITK